MISDPESGSRKPKNKGVFMAVSRILLQSFTLTFLAEWGDRSQLTTIILGAREVRMQNFLFFLTDILRIKALDEIPLRKC